MNPCELKKEESLDNHATAIRVNVAPSSVAIHSNDAPLCRATRISDELMAKTDQIVPQRRGTARVLAKDIFDP
jgi:hypothetical protein